MKRNDFIKRLSAIMVLGVPFLSVTGSCTNNADDPGPTKTANDPKDCLANGTTTSIGSNHGHTLTVSKTDVNAAVDKTYSIQGTSGHSHDVTITASNFTTLQSNKNIQVTSTSASGHVHSITVGCA